MAMPHSSEMPSFLSSSKNSTWAGLGNVHYWIDPASGIAGVWAMQLLPFFDPAAREALESFERAVYRVLTDEYRT